ncbi:hypothetical protein [Paenibacillus sp. TAF43_2]
MLQSLRNLEEDNYNSSKLFIVGRFTAIMSPRNIEKDQKLRDERQRQY